MPKKVKKAKKVKKVKKKPKKLTRSRVSASHLVYGVPAEWHTGYVAERDGMTQSLVQSWDRCKQAAILYLEGWRRIGLKDSLAFGSLGHKIDELRRLGELDADGLDEFLEDYIAAQLAKGEDAAQTEMICAKAAAVFPVYFDRYADDLKPKLCRWRGVESVFDVQWRGHRLRGMRDGLLQLKKRKAPGWGPYTLFETKTKGQISSTIEDVLAIDFQNQYYLEASEAELDLLDQIKTVLYNIIRNPGQKLGKGETLQQYTARVAKEVEKKPDHFFIRYAVDYPKSERKIFRAELELKLSEFTAWSHGERPTWRSQTGCVGRWNCDGLTACTSGSTANYSQTKELFEELNQD